MSPLVLVMAAALAAGDASTPAPSANPAPETAPQAARSMSDPNRMVCKTEAVTGSRFEKRICRPKADWDDMTARAEEMQRVNNQRTGMGVTQSNPMGGH